jgi:hypothetical protein
MKKVFGILGIGLVGVLVGLLISARINVSGSGKTNTNGLNTILRGHSGGGFTFGGEHRG